MIMKKENIHSHSHIKMRQFPINICNHKISNLLSIQLERVFYIRLFLEFISYRLIVVVDNKVNFVLFEILFYLNSVARSIQHEFHEIIQNPRPRFSRRRELSSLSVTIVKFSFLTLYSFIAF